MKSDTKSFAFKLAERRASMLPVTQAKWKIRDGVSLAGCTLLPDCALAELVCNGPWDCLGDVGESC